MGLEWDRINIMDFQEWDGTYGRFFPAEIRVKVEAWCKKGMEAEWALTFFFPSQVVKFHNLDRCVSQYNGVFQWSGSPPAEAHFWVLKLKDGIFQMVKNTPYENSTGERLGEVSRGSSFEECLKKAETMVEHSVIERLIRDRGSKGLML